MNSHSQLTDEEVILTCLKNGTLKLTASKMNGLRKSADSIKKKETSENKRENESVEYQEYMEVRLSIISKLIVFVIM